MTWRRGKGYDATEVANLYIADDVWVSKMLKALCDKVCDASRMIVLGFCVSVANAEFMASSFERAGLSALALKALASVQARVEALGTLARGDLRIIFTVDLFSEGVDVPAVDVVLMLRPTESAIVFQQQLGRGLRRSDGKDVLTVLDFVSHHRKEFRFEARRNNNSHWRAEEPYRGADPDAGGGGLVGTVDQLKARPPSHQATGGSWARVFSSSPVISWTLRRKLR